MTNAFLRTPLFVAAAGLLASGCLGRGGPDLVDVAEVDAAGYRTIRHQEGAYDEDALVDTREGPDILAAIQQAPQQQAAGRAPTQIAQVTPGLSLCDVVQAPPEVQAAVVSLPPLAEVRGVTLIRAPVTGGCIVSGFGMADVRGRPNGGLDFFGQSQVLAAADGTVVGFGEIPDFGLVLVLDHGDGVRTRYANLGSVGENIVRGAAVARGQQVGVMGRSGMLPEDGLHYELEIDGRRVDPLGPPAPEAG
ncbi:MAG: M23 family metallopeptidase [Pseudomonadota bacterium]